MSVGAQETIVVLLAIFAAVWTLVAFALWVVGHHFGWAVIVGLIAFTAALLWSVRIPLEDED